ncbi:K02A2.6-like [Cordylochernes scorpioides]|uniref:RNA-directed DNA polymerase n=1 Tax=Cordylochernes scorpioides TaxID=51811 RepID=A0ABY6K1J5_9ARAC|nr:K02A2.6-like [Cordylochernes scorpioides]
MAVANQRLENAGTFVAKLRANTREMKETVYVVYHLEQPLLGVGACEDLQFVKRTDLLINGITDVNPEREFPKLFEGLGLLEQPYHIKLKEGAKPFPIPVPRRVPLPLMPKLKEQLDAMVAQEVIEPVDEPTEWCAPIVLAGKPNGKIRICVDLSRLNLSVERELHPLPVLEHELAQLNGAKIFSRLDANNGFWQIKLSEESQTLTTFITPFGRYKFKRLLFGISSAPEHFQKGMSAILRGVNGVICHMDDILIFAKRKEEHDALSRQPLPGHLHEDEELQEEVEHFVRSIVLHQSTTDDRLAKIALNQKLEPTLQNVAFYSKNGWPAKCQLSPVERSFYDVRNKIGEENGLLMRGLRVIIPSNMRKDVLDHIHADHQGITKCRARAKDHVWWPGIGQEIQDMVKTCEKCIENQPLKHEPLIPNDFPERPWQKVGMDLFHYEGTPKPQPTPAKIEEVNEDGKTKAMLKAERKAAFEAMRKDLNKDKGEGEAKSKSELRAERRAKQEAQREAKTTANQQQPGKLPAPQQKSASKPTGPPAKPEPKPTATKEPPATKPPTSETEKPFFPITKIITAPNMGVQTLLILYEMNYEIPEYLVRLGMDLAKRKIRGTMLSLNLTLYCLRTAISEYETPPGKLLSRDLEKQIKFYADFLNHCWPLSLPAETIIRDIREKINCVSPTCSDTEAKEILMADIDKIMRQEADLATEVLVELLVKSIQEGETLVTCALRVLVEAHRKDIHFTVVILDHGPLYEGFDMMALLLEHGVKCTYVDCSLNSLMPQYLGRGLLGANAYLAGNCSIITKAGTAQLCQILHRFKQTVEVCFQNCKVVLEAAHTGYPGSFNILSLPVPPESQQNSSSSLGFHYDRLSRDMYDWMYTEKSVQPKGESTVEAAKLRIATSS